MRFPSRLLLAGSVIGALAASGSTALTMSDRVVDAAVDVPSFPSSPAQGAPAAPSAAVAPPVTGSEIVALAVAPAKERANALIAAREKAKAEAAEAAAEAARLEAERQAATTKAPGFNRQDLERLREQIREACDDGRLRGVICRRS